MLSYAGIGSRSTPDNVIQMMQSIGEQLAPNWIVRSGFADGADKAFCFGAEQGNGQMEIYIPWEGFNDAPDTSEDGRFIVPDMTREVYQLAEHFHPNWSSCSAGVRKLHARNVFQVLGKDLNTPAEMVICWTPMGSGKGGTGQAIRIANHFGVPVFDLALESHIADLCTFTHLIEKQAA